MTSLAILIGFSILGWVTMMLILGILARYHKQIGEMLAFKFLMKWKAIHRLTIEQHTLLIRPIHARKCAALMNVIIVTSGLFMTASFPGLFQPYPDQPSAEDPSKAVADGVGPASISKAFRFLCALCFLFSATTICTAFVLLWILSIFENDDGVFDIETAAYFWLYLQIVRASFFTSVLVSVLATLLLGWRLLPFGLALTISILAGLSMIMVISSMYLFIGLKDRIIPHVRKAGIRASAMMQSTAGKASSSEGRKDHAKTRMNVAEV